MLFGDCPKGNKFANAGVGENNIDSPLRLSDGLVKTIKIGQFGNVSLDARDVAPDCLHGLVEFLLAAARDEDISTLFDKKLCRSQSNPFGPSTDHSGLAFELFSHRFCPLLLELARTPRGPTHLYVGNVVPNMGRLLTDCSSVASSSIPSQCSARSPF